MLYTTTPLERIYHDFQEEKEKEDIEEERKEIAITHGTITARKSGDKYVIEKIHSTNPEDYLNALYCPGMVVEGKEKIDFI